VVSATDPHGRILGFLDRKVYVSLILIYTYDNRDVSIQTYNVGVTFVQLLLLCLNSL
jgi:hypothetical protein